MIYLMTDYGTKDYFVSALKIVINNFLNNFNLKTDIIDITHNIERHNVLEGIINLQSVLDIVNNNSIFLVVIDPQVGSNQDLIYNKPIFAKFSKNKKELYIISRNSGILTAFYNKNYKLEFIYKISLKNILKDIKLKGIFYKSSITNIDNTFHGKAVFSPIAALTFLKLNNINYLDKFIIKDYNLKPFIYKDLFKIEINQNFIKGNLLYSDHFGNILTNIPNDKLKKIKYAMIINENFNENKILIKKMYSSYSQALRDELFFIKGSFGYLEISINKKSALEYLINHFNIDKVNFNITDFKIIVYF
ncbi:MAG: SAM hydrolase/SAM-dependent halogenase family protein [bacterium]